MITVTMREMEELVFGLESMYQHCRFVIEEMTYGDKPFDEKTCDYCEALMEECDNFLMKHRWNKSDLARIREIAVEREILRDMKCLG